MPPTVESLFMLFFASILIIGIIFILVPSAPENCGIISNSSKCRVNPKCTWNDVETPEYRCLTPPSLSENNECSDYGDICSQHKTQTECEKASSGCYYIQRGEEEGRCMHAPPNADLEHDHDIDYLTIQVSNKDYCNSKTFDDTNGGMCDFIPGSVYNEYHENGTFTPQHAKPQCFRKFNKDAQHDTTRWYCPSKECSDDADDYSIKSSNCRVTSSKTEPDDICKLGWQKYTDCGVFTKQAMFSRKDRDIIRDQGIDVWIYDGQDPMRLCEGEKVAGITTKCEYTDIHHKNGTPEHKQFCSNI